MAGLLSGLFGGGSAPEPKTVALDDGTQRLIDEGAARSQRDASAFGDDLNKGVAQAAQAFAQPAQAPAGQDDGLYSALRQSYNTRGGSGLKNLMQQNQYKGVLEKADRMRQVSSQMAAQQNVAAQNMAMLTQAYNQSEAARAGLIGSLFQLAGTGMAISAANSKAKTKTPVQEQTQWVGGSGNREEYGTASMESLNQYGMGQG